MTAGEVTAIVACLIGILTFIFAFVKTRNGNGNQSEKLLSQLVENSIKQTAILEQSRELHKDNGTKIDLMAGNLSIAMERQSQYINKLKNQ